MAKWRTTVTSWQALVQNDVNSEIPDRRGTPMGRASETQEPVICTSKPLYRRGREPSFTAMWHACLRNTHATTNDWPVFADTRSVQLIPADVTPSNNC